MKLLIANRGEIALRIIRSAKEMGIKTVAVYSEADRNALHVRHADEAVCIGPPPSAQSYLNIDAILAACNQTGATAIHPGYGFLSENAAFARAVKQAGLTFVGPSAEAMDVMGNKLSAKEAARKFNIPMVPGTDGAVNGIAEANREAAKIGFPLLIKAAAGGGGKGMRVVHRHEDLEEQMGLAISEAKSAFNDGSVFIERYMQSPRHIEIQVLGDEYGNIIHLFERDCSVQRRHQKVVEEAPSGILDPVLRDKMGRCAVDVARACNYTSAGTVEFIMDGNLDFYFLEMNTRLQVEHPVTEMITGIDLVKEQIRIARGEKLSFTQDDIRIKGHAIELRVYAEDPENGFLPDTGVLTTYKLPQGPGIRVDGGFEQGMEVPIYYDPMIAKLVAYGQNREEAISRMLRAINEYEISGIKTTLGFGRFVMQHEAFGSGKFDTHFVSNYYQPEQENPGIEDEALIAALLAERVFSEKSSSSLSPVQTRANTSSAWRTNRKSG